MSMIRDEYQNLNIQQGITKRSLERSYTNELALQWVGTVDSRGFEVNHGGKF